MKMTIKASEAKIGQWYSWNERVLCVSNDGRNPVFVRRSSGDDGSVSFVTVWQDSPVTHLPDCDGWDWEPPKPTYRPFKSAHEFTPYRGQWVADQYGEIFRVTRYNDKSVDGCDCGYALDNWTFDDGSPFGVKKS